MPLLHLVLLALIQGITEFLPVSSSGHLILLPKLTGLQDQGLALDVAVHAGTLVAVVLYFWTDVKIAATGTTRLVRGRIDTPGAFLALCLLIATVPVVLVGIVLKMTGLTEAMRSVAVIGWTMLGFGLLLWWFDARSPVTRAMPQWTLKHAAIMGLWQVLALIPGTSRSGITITGGRALGYDRRSAATLSMLMSIPTILASAAVLSVDVVQDATGGLLLDAAIAAGFAFVSALAALALMMKLLRSVSFLPYVIYRIVLGAALLGYAYL